MIFTLNNKNTFQNLEVKLVKQVIIEYKKKRKKKTIF